MANFEGPQSATLQIGEQVQVEWGGAWYPAQVLGHTADGGVRIHYVGYDESSDETVTADRIMRGAAPAAGAPVMQAAPPPGPVASGYLEALLLGNPVTDRKS